jgi:integrase
MSTIFLHPKRKSYYHRSYVPTVLRQLLHDRFEVWRSLDTADKDEASVRAAQWEARIKRLFVTLKKEGHRMTQGQIDQLVNHWLDSALEESDDSRLVHGPYNEDQRDMAYDLLVDQLEESADALESFNLRKVEKEADGLLKAAGLPALDHDGADFGRLCRQLLQAKIDYASIEMDRWRGKYKKHRPVIHPATPSPAAMPKMPTGPLFSEVAKKYFIENARAERTDVQAKAEFKRFVEVIGGDRAIDAITKADCRTYKDYLKDTRKVGPATIIKHFSSLSSLFKWSEAQEYQGERTNPTKGLPPSKKAAKKAALEIRPFTSEQLLTIFGSREFIEQRTTNPARYWVTLIGLFQGCRREEGGQLNLSDIGEDKEIPFIHITNEGEDQSIKTGSVSRRKVPVHSSLIALGFLQYVKSIKDEGHTRLFPTLTHGANGFSDAPGKWFGRLLDKLDLSSPSLVFHSLRHSAITNLEGAGVARHVVNFITGHSEGGAHAGYVHRDVIPLVLLRDGLEKLRYDAVVEALMRS